MDILHKALVELREAMRHEPSHAGICYNILRFLPDGARLLTANQQLRRLLKRWPDSASLGWSDSLVEGSIDAYYTPEATANRWNPEHPWGKRRWQLLDWLIEETRHG